MISLLKFLAEFGYNCWIEPSGPHFEPKDYPDLTGKKWLVTGATGGIGLEISKILASLNAELWLVGRNKSKLDAAEALLKRENPRLQTHQVLIDYADLRTVQPAIVALKTETSSLDGIIHNAGMMDAAKGAKTEQGIDLTIGVNSVATQYVQDLLDPLIVNTPNGRIVWLSSMGHIAAPPHGFNVKAVADSHPFTAYAVSKAMNYIQSVQWSHNHPESPVKSLSVHPGLIKTEISRNSSFFSTLIFRLFGYEMSLGAQAPIFAALSPAAVNNDYIVPWGKPGPVRPDIYAAARNELGEATIAWIHDKIKASA